MVISLAFCDCELPFLWHAIVMCFRDCDGPVSRYAIVIRLAFCNGADLLVDWLATLRDGALLVLFTTIVIRFLLRDADSLG